jgi:uncharacterized protein YecE (DUF72 family)
MVTTQAVPQSRLSEYAAGMRVAVGTSGFSYKEWVGSFYPPKLPAARMLQFYAEQLPTVELNNTFYRMPNEALLKGWKERTPSSFHFVLKAPRQLTHIKKLADCEEALARFTGLARTLGEKLGPLLFQLPPTFRQDTERLLAFLRLLPSDVRAAFEFRHPSWFNEATYSALREHGAALCIAEVDDQPPPLVATANFGYFRLRREDYTPEQVADWARAIAAQPFAEAYVFFKHEVRAPALALGLSEHFSQQPRSENSGAQKPSG